MKAKNQRNVIYFFVSSGLSSKHIKLKYNPYRKSDIAQKPHRIDCYLYALRWQSWNPSIIKRHQCVSLGALSGQLTHIMLRNAFAKMAEYERIYSMGSSIHNTEYVGSLADSLF